MLTDYKSKRYRTGIKLVQPIILKQQEDITKKKYCLFIHNETFKEVYYYKNSNKVSALSKTGEGLTAFGIELDFDDKISEITIEFKNDMAEPLTLSLEFVDADKEAYYAKIKQKETEEKLKKLNVSHACGNDLVNIKFQNCSENVSYTIIALYTFKDRPKNGFNGETERIRQLMATYKVEEGVFFKAIKDLAYGKYEYVVSQFDKENKLIVSTEFIEFKIFKPNYSGRGLVGPH